MILLHSPLGEYPPEMPNSVSLPCAVAAKAFHFLSGVGGWAAERPAEEEPGESSMIVRLEYADGEKEDHPLYSGIHFADYVHRFDVPGSKFAFELARDRQIRYFAIHPKRRERLRRLGIVKGTDHTAPVVMAITVEALE